MAAPSCAGPSGSKAINDKRNRIVHQGKFANPEEEVKAAIDQAKTFIEALMRIYVPGFVLDGSCASAARPQKASALAL